MFFDAVRITKGKDTSWMEKRWHLFSHCLSMLIKKGVVSSEETYSLLEYFN